jgi:hypothetical protein
VLILPFQTAFINNSLLTNEIVISGVMVEFIKNVGSVEPSDDVVNGC